MASISEIEKYTNAYLKIRQYKDYCPNGLQVEGKREVSKIVCGVTACLDLIDAAIAENADALLVHHGYFWRGESPAIVGMKAQRIHRLLDSGISLLAYHLPLDAHLEVGNNVQLAQVLGMTFEGILDEDSPRPIAIRCSLDKAFTAEALADHIGKALHRQPLLIGKRDASIQTVGLCTGAAQDYIEHAVRYGLDAFVSGEVSERTTHIAREEGICYYAAGHHATERYGVQALAQHLSQKFGLESQFIDIENPV